ncbi:MAG: hypothetical protein WBQ60_03085 [Asticcacaulis sp.]
MKSALKPLVFALGLAVMTGQVQAATPTTEALSACLTRSTTPDDQIVLSRWAFAVMARHPGLSDLANISEAQYAAVNQAGGTLFTRLLTKDCTAETSAAIRNDGQDGVTEAFTQFGQTALQGLIRDPQVQSSLSNVLQYVDQGALLRALMNGY